MVGMLLQLAKEHQNKYVKSYQYFRVPHMGPNVCFCAQKLFREPLTGRIRPQKPRGAKDAREDVVSQLVKLNLQTTLHEHCCGRGEGIVPLPNYMKKLKSKKNGWPAEKKRP